MSYSTQEAIAELRDEFEEALNSTDMDFVNRTADKLARLTGWEVEAQILKDYFNREVNDWVE